MKPPQPHLTPEAARHYLWLAGNLSYKLHATQKLIDDAVNANPANEVLVLSSRQLGKSYWQVCYALSFAIQNPGKTVRILAPTLKQVADIVNDNLSAIIQDAPPGLITRHKTAYRYKLANGSEIRLGCLERAHVDNNRGGHASLIITEEGGFVSSEDFKYAIESVISPQLLRSGGKLVHISSPSEEPDHYLHTETKPKCELTNSLFRFTIYDNPQLTPQRIEQAKELMGGEGSDGWKREYLAEIIRPAESVIIPEFNKATNVKESPLPTSLKYTMTIDFGGKMDSHGITLSYFDFKRGKVVFLDSLLLPPQTNTEDVINACKAMEATHNVTECSRYADASGQLLIDISNKLGYDVRLPLKDDRDAAINNLRLGFAQDKIEINPRCVGLIVALENGRWNSKRTDFARSKALGHWDLGVTAVYAYRVQDKSNPYPIRQLELNQWQRPSNREQSALAAVAASMKSSFTRGRK